MNYPTLSHKFVLLPAVLLGFASTAHAQYDWGSDNFFSGDTATDLEDPNGNELPAPNNWLIQLFLSPDGSMDPFASDTTNTVVSAGGSPVTATVADEGFAGQFHSVFDLSANLEGLDVFTVIVDSDDVGGAGQWAIIDDSLHTVSGTEINTGGLLAADWNDATCPTGEFWGTTGCVTCTALANCSSLSCTNAGDSQCSACQNGYFIDGGTCSACTPCSPGEFSEDVCDGLSSSDLSCASCDVCESDEFEAVACTASSDIDCQSCNAACSSCNGAGSSDCTDCAPGFWNDGGSCVPCGICSQGEYEATACGASSNTVCMDCNSVCTSCNGATVNDCSSCTAGFWNDSGSCKACSSCSGTQFETSSCGSNADTVCTDCDSCLPGEYVASACTDTNNTVCSTCNLACAECTGASASDCGGCASGFWNDAGRCTACTACSSAEAQVDACTQEADTVCRDEGNGEILESTGCNCSSTHPGAYFAMFLWILFVRPKRWRR